MTAPTFAHENRRLAVRARWLLRIEGQTLLNLAHTLLLALPFVLLTGDGVVFWSGILYALGYLVLMLMPTALYVLLMFDALRVLFRRPAIFLPLLIAIGRAGRSRVEMKSPLTMLLKLGITGNPLASLTRELWLLAWRFNEDGITAIESEAERIGQQMQARQSSMTAHLVAAELRTVPRHKATNELVAC